MEEREAEETPPHPHQSFMGKVYVGGADAGGGHADTGNFRLALFSGCFLHRYGGGGRTGCVVMEG